MSANEMTYSKGIEAKEIAGLNAQPIIIVLPRTIFHTQNKTKQNRTTQSGIALCSFFTRIFGIISNDLFRYQMVIYWSFLAFYSDIVFRRHMQLVKGDRILTISKLFQRREQLQADEYTAIDQIKLKSVASLSKAIVFFLRIFYYSNKQQFYRITSAQEFK